MTPLQTPEQAIAFLNAGHTGEALDLQIFWGALGVSLDAIWGIAASASKTLSISPDSAMNCLIAGARLAIRADLKLKGEDNE